MERVIFLGQKTVGERCLRVLSEASGALDIVGVASNTDTSVWWGSAGVFDFATQEGVPFIANDERREAELLALIADQSATAVISVQHPWILSASVLDAVDRRAWNLHNAKLPDYQGYNAANHAILNGDNAFTSTVHWMTPEADAGEVAFTETFPLTGRETAASLYDKAIEAGVAAFRRLVECLRTGEPVPREPLRGQVRFYARTSTDALRRIDNPADPDELDRKARAFWFPPFEPAFIEARGRRFHVAPEDRSG